MYTILSENGQQTTCKDMAHVKRVLKIVVKHYGREELKGLYVWKQGAKDPLFAKDLV